MVLHLVAVVWCCAERTGEILANTGLLGHLFLRNLPMRSDLGRVPVGWRQSWRARPPLLSTALLPCFHRVVFFWEAQGQHQRCQETMPTDQEYDDEIEKMETEEHEYLEYVLDLALMEEPWESAAAFRRRLDQIDTLGVLRATIEAKVRQHGFSTTNVEEFC